MINIEIKPTEIFKKNYLSNAQILINRGGAGSSKSYSIAQLLTIIFLQAEQVKILALRKSSAYIQHSLDEVFKEVFDQFGIRHLITENKTKRFFKYNKNIIQLSSVDDPEKYKSSKWNYIWFEETTEFSFHEFKTIALRNRAQSLPNRPNQIIFTFNPTSELSWIKTMIIDSNKYDYKEINSSYKDNPYLEEFYINSLIALEQQDINFYRIYTLGEWGILENIVYNNWQIIDDLPKDNNSDVFYGLDFGYNNPSSLVKLSSIDSNIYASVLIYESKLTNIDLIEKMNQLIPNKNHPIYADSAEPQRIEEIHRDGFNIHPADKSVKDGIDFVKRQTLKIHKESLNLIKELQTYSYRKNKLGQVIDEPIKFNDHALDALRYGIFSHLIKKYEPNITWITL
ncbi:MAG: PBSX family phage terminase large subunit [Nitrospirae bacterium]|nr:PBSX family phage terminase large subunit [Nitrospirota bacterium]MBF0540583.1 PBSX family phage terminase large subunit [Nitrospirota bacterium]